MMPFRISAGAMWFAAACSCLLPISAAAEPSAPYFTPEVAPGAKLSTVFSKAVSIRGTDFDPYVRRVSGTATDTIEAVAPEALTLRESYDYDGGHGGESRLVIRDRGVTFCYDSKCAPYDQTSSAVFSPSLWGKIPTDIKVGSHWSAKLDAPWEIGPRGDEEITVERLVRSDRLIVLQRRGAGEGPSSDDAVARTIKIVSHGRTLTVTVVPGPTRWEGLAVVSRGLTLSDEIIATRRVKLVSDAGETFEGEERVYTLFIASP